MTNTPQYWFTSDTHWAHTNIIKFCPTTRPCKSVEEMDELLIERWNDTVPKDGIVFHLGDFTFSNDVEYVQSVIRRLNGNKNLILGNHDSLIRKTPKLRDMFGSVSDYKRIQIDKQTLILSHFPMRSWDKMHHSSFHLYGHCHGSLEGTPWGKSMDVGIDARPLGDMRPWSYEEIREKLTNRDVMSHH